MSLTEIRNIIKDAYIIITNKLLTKMEIERDGNIPVLTVAGNQHA